MIAEGQKLSEGDCVYNLTKGQAHELLSMVRFPWLVKNLIDGIVFSGGNLYPTYMGYCSELEEYNFADFKQLCENTFGDGAN